jgi:hypothetical protein
LGKDAFITFRKFPHEFPTDYDIYYSIAEKLKSFIIFAWFTGYGSMGERLIEVFSVSKPILTYFF